MNANRLLALYDHVGDAPNAVPTLRRFVLDLAVRGKLVEQDPVDRPEPELLKRIVSHPSGQREIPPNWRRAEVGMLLELRYGKGLKAGERLDDGPVPVFGSNGIVGYSDAALTDNPAIIVGRKGSAGALNICHGPSWTTDVAYYVETPSFFIPRFLFIAMFALDLHTLGKGVKPGLSRTDVYELCIDVPPLAEQRRIMARVDELTALCDQLERARTIRETGRDRLTAASLARLTASDIDAQSFRACARFTLDAVPALTRRSDQINIFRQTILNLAVRGKLVEQDTTDESASDLLERIAAKQSWSSRKAPAKKLTARTDVSDDDAPFDLPNGWAWARFPELGILGRGKSKHRPRNDPALFDGGTHPMIQTGDVARSQGVITTYTAKYNDIGLAQSMKWPKGTMCITIAANIADSGILGFDACFPDSVVGFRPASVFENARYFEYFIRTAKANLIEFAPATAQKNINLAILRSVLIPLPPLVEQRRIVAKVDELMGLCDQLETGLRDTDAIRRRLLGVLLQKALSERVLPASVETLEAAG